MKTPSNPLNDTQRPGIDEKQARIILRFSRMEDWLDRYRYLITLERKLPPMRPEFKTERATLSGCQSRVWLHTELVDGKVQIHADSDSRIIRGILALLIEVLDGESPQEIMKANLHFIQTIGLERELSPSRARGLHLLVERMNSIEESVGVPPIHRQTSGSEAYSGYLKPL